MAMNRTDTALSDGMRTDIQSLARDLAAIVGGDHVHDDSATRTFHSQDIYTRAAETAALVVAPADTAQLAAVVAACAAAGHPCTPRGGGMSYTKGYLPTSAATVMLDLGRMDKVLDVRADDMVVTVQAGCTWKTLNDTLAPLGLRTPYWGPLSGLLSTVGGGLSQGNAFFGAGHHGTSSESMVALTLVMADGRILRTGARGADGDSPYYRFYGPDLAGIFTGDCGTLAIKAEITLRLIPLPQHEAYASFSFKTDSDMFAAMAAITRAGIACEICGFDPRLTRIRLKRASLAADLGALKNVVGKQSTLLGGLKEAAKIALAGRGFIDDGDYALHIVCEGRSAAGVADDLAAARAIAARHQGHEVENTIPKVFRAQPFVALNAVLGPGGERWAPIHALTPLSRAHEIFTAMEAELTSMRAELNDHKVEHAYLFTAMSTNAIIIEPVFYWPDALLEVHEAVVESNHLAKLTRNPPNPAAAAMVEKARQRLLALFLRNGLAHFQIGRTYPYLPSRDAASIDLLRALKAALDPAHTLNPGALGL
ncbi:FAD-binding oxidoreductase [Nitrospirillum sp. BR 11828]|uniref:FAD-binding oxidoreductase n=1 Tax=Nitrospirillum sp. BR 11828 TaxID=3104325 RepID=UPI002ACAFBD6|nr:FAD-binding oxidoreductase [Nitrospirillum sp. BR 11828]MDZ5650033.1 FAD-binding oxidoreductase [Nitrospirillum sp. BR 11828]